MSLHAHQFDNTYLGKAMFEQYYAAVQADKDFIKKAKIDDQHTVK